MALFTQKTEAERTADAARKAADAARRAEAAFWASPQGKAAQAFERGDEFLQIEIPHSSITGFTNAAFNSATAGKIRRQLTRTDLLGQIEESGWRLEHADWVYIQTGQNSRDKFLASGQHVVVTGEVVGIYLFRRDDARVNRATPPKAPATPRSLPAPNSNSKPLTSPAKQLDQPSTPPSSHKPTPGVMGVGARVKVKSAGDDYDGKIGTVQTHLDDDGDGLTIGVIFKGDKHLYAFSPTELTVVTD
jgi:hypothetical protein